MSANFKFRVCADTTQQIPSSGTHTTGALFSRVASRSAPRTVLEFGKGSSQFGSSRSEELNTGESPVSLTRTENGTDSTQLEDAKPSVDDGEGSAAVSTPRDEIPGSTCLSTPRDEEQSATAEGPDSSQMESVNLEVDEASVSMGANTSESTPVDVVTTGAGEADQSSNIPSDGSQPLEGNDAGAPPSSSLRSSKERVGPDAESGTTLTTSGMASWKSRFGASKLSDSLRTSLGNSGRTDPPFTTPKTGSARMAAGNADEEVERKTNSTRLPLSTGEQRESISRTGSSCSLDDGGEQKTTPRPGSTRFQLSLGTLKGSPPPRTSSMRLPLSAGDQTEVPPTSSSMRLPRSTGNQKDALPGTGSLRLPSSTGDQKAALPGTGSLRLPSSTGDQKDAISRIGSMRSTTPADDQKEAPSTVDSMRLDPSADDPEANPRTISSRLLSSASDQKDIVPRTSPMPLQSSNVDQKTTPGTDPTSLPLSTGQLKATSGSGLSTSSGDQKATAFGTTRSSSPLRRSANDVGPSLATSGGDQKTIATAFGTTRTSSPLRRSAVSPRPLAALEKDSETLDSLEQMQAKMQANQVSVHTSQIHVLSRELGELQKQFLSFKRDVNQTVEDLWTSFTTSQDEALDALRSEFDQSARNPEEMTAAWEEAHNALSASVEKGLSDLAEHNAKALEEHAFTNLKALEEHTTSHARELADLRSGHSVDLKNVVMDLTKQVDQLTLDLAQVASDCAAAQEEGYAALRLELTEHGGDVEEMKAAWEEAHEALSKALDDGLSRLADELAKALDEHTAKHSESFEQLQNEIADEFARLNVERAPGRLQVEMADKLNSMFGRMKSAMDVKFKN